MNIPEDARADIAHILGLFKGNHINWYEALNQIFSYLTPIIEKQARREIGEWLDGDCCKTGKCRRTCMHCQFMLDDALKQGELPQREQEGKG